MIKRGKYDDNELDEEIRRITTNVIIQAITKTADYFALWSDSVLFLDGTNNTVTLTLPIASETIGKIYYVKAIDLTNAVTVENLGTDTIEGAANYSFVTANDVVCFASDGTSDWKIISDHLEFGSIDHDALLNFAANEHFTEASIDHANIQNIGTNTHAQIDTHVALVNEHIDWTAATQDFLTTGNATLKILKLRFGSSAELFSENFEGFGLGVDLTSGDWTWDQYAAETATFETVAGVYAECKMTSGNWAGGFRYTGAGASAWTNYEVTFDVKSYGSGRFVFGFRMGAASGYWLQCLPNAANESKIFTGNVDYPSAASAIDTQTPPASVTSCKITIDGSTIKVYYNGSGSATHDYIDATYSTGSISIGAFQAGWVIDNIVVTDTSEKNTTITPLSTGGISIVSDTDLVGIGTATPQRYLDVGDSNDPQARLTHTNNTYYVDLQADSSGNCKILPSGSTINLGNGAAGIDYILLFDGETNDGILTWMEDEDYFKFSDDILMENQEAIYFDSSDTYIRANADDPEDLEIGADQDILLQADNQVLTDTVIRAATTLYRRYYHLSLASFDPGASGATWTSAGANNLAGWQLNAVGETLHFQTDVYSDWDAVSDLEVKVKFQLLDSGSVLDTVDLKLVCYYMGTGDTSTKTQTVEVATITDGTQYKLYSASFVIDYDAASNVADAGDLFSFLLNLETDTSEIDNILIVAVSFNYNTTHLGIESGDT